MDGSNGGTYRVGRIQMDLWRIISPNFASMDEALDLIDFSFGRDMRMHRFRVC